METLVSNYHFLLKFIYNFLFSAVKISPCGDGEQMSTGKKKARQVKIMTSMVLLTKVVYPLNLSEAVLYFVV